MPPDHALPYLKQLDIEIGEIRENYAEEDYDENE